MSLTTGVAEDLRSKIGEAEQELQVLRSALLVLDGQPKRQPSTPKPAPTRRSNGQNKPSNGTVLSEEKVLAAVRSGQDQARTIAEEFGTDTDTVRDRLKALEGAGAAKRTGARALTRWHAVAT